VGASEDRDSFLYGSMAAGAAFVLILAGLFLLPHWGAPSFDATQRTALLGVAVMGLWLLGGSAPWAAEDPLYARALRRTAVAPFLATLALVMFFVRIMGKGVLFSGGGIPLGNDPDTIYHFREMIGAVRAFPQIPRFDPWTFYPHGTLAGQFGTLYDWILAAIIVLVHGRGATEATIAQWLAWYPPILGSLLVVPFYFLARRLMGRSGAIVASVTLALLPGDLLYRSVIGSADHDVGQDLFGIFAMLGMVWAVQRAHAARDAFHARDWKRIARPALWAVLGGILFAANLYVWPPGILFVVIVAVWLGLVVLVKDAQGQDSLGYVAGGAIVLVTCGLLMLPIIESTNLGEFTTYSILHPLACFATAAVLVAVHWLGRFFRARGAKPWAVPLATVALGIAGIVALFTLPFQFFGSLRWGFSWVSGIGVQRTMTTISEARSASIFCDPTTEGSCLVGNYGPLVEVGAIVLVALLVWILMRRRASDLLLFVWGLTIFQATVTQAHFAHYLAINLALLTGWVAARVAEGTGFERVPEQEADAEARAEAEAKPKGKAAKGRKTRAATAARPPGPTPLKALAVGAILLLVLPGNVFATNGTSPGWLVATSAASPGELWFWQPSLEWLRDNTPDAGVDLTKIYAPPAPGHDPDYPPNTYGVLTWWDYGFYIETIGHRPPVANPFQQAAPFAASWFTERDPARAEQLLDQWVGDKPPVRYVMIDNEIGVPFSKFGAITVWANSLNASRPPLVDQATQRIDGAWVSQGSFDGPDGPKTFSTSSALFTDSMMGRLYDANGDGLSHYRMVWQMQGFQAVGDATDANGNFACLSGTLNGGGGCVNVDLSTAANTDAGSYVKAGGSYVYDMHLVSPLVIFERVKGAHLVGTATPGAEVTAECRVQPQPGSSYAFDYHVTARAGPDGKYDVTFPYSNADKLGVADGGTNFTSVVEGNIVVSWPGIQRPVVVTVPDRAVLNGEQVAVPSA
jgi:dolichyl-diphosphooligosaccharide--protein glycosyltransferase